jgi:hypothetical protein
VKAHSWGGFGLLSSTVPPLNPCNTHPCGFSCWHLRQHVHVVNLFQPCAHMWPTNECLAVTQTLVGCVHSQVRCRAVPYEPSSPVAQELCGLSGGANPNSPFSIDWAAQEGTASTASTLRGTLDPTQTQQQQQQQTMLGSGTLGASGSPRTPGGSSTGNVTADILNFEHRKVSVGSGVRGAGRQEAGWSGQRPLVILL